MRRIYSAALALLACPIVALAIDGSATGTLTVNGQTSTLTQAYARMVPDPFDKTKDAVEITLSDVPLAPDALGDDPFPVIHLADAGKAHAIALTINAQKQIVSLSMRDSAFKKTSPSGAGSDYKFDAQTFDRTTVAGKLSCAKPQQALGEVWDFSATFSAPIAARPAPKPAAPVAADNPIAKVAAAFLKAAHAGDVATMKKLVTPDGAKQFDGPDAKDMLELMKMMAPASPRITSVQMDTPTEASVKIEEHETNANGSSSSTITLKLVKLGSEWNVDPSR